MDFTNHPLNSKTFNVSTNNLNNVERITLQLMDKLNDNHSYKFFKLVATKLPEYIIWTNLEIALTKRKPAAYFSTVCKAEMRKV